MVLIQTTNVIRYHKFNSRKNEKIFAFFHVEFLKNVKKLASMQDRSAWSCKDECLPGCAMEKCLRISGKCFGDGQALVIEHAGVDEMETQKLSHDCPMMFGWSVWTERIDLELPGSDKACCKVHEQIIDIANSVRKCCKKVMYSHQHGWDDLFCGDVTVKLLKDKYNEMCADLTDAYTMLNEAMEIIDELDARIFLWQIGVE